jgi:hypothetical protein
VMADTLFSLLVCAAARVCAYVGGFGISERRQRPGDHPSVSRTADSWFIDMLH